MKVNSFLNEFSKEKIKEKVDIVALLDFFGVRLEKKGEEYKGLCPFHEETEPSFSVNREKGMYHCFGCGAGGDCFTLVEEMKKTDFKGALVFLKEFSNTRPAFLKRVVLDRKEPDLKEKALVKAETIYCGNLLSETELKSLGKVLMTKRLKNRFGDNRINMKVNKGQFVPFMIVFSNVPSGLEEYSVQVAGSEKT